MADGYTSFKDMFDGGGAGQSGDRFEGGGVLSAIGNAVARPAGSRERGDTDQRTGIGGLMRDAVNGGGWGQSGQTFSGGPYSNFANMIGVRPMGANQRGEEMLQQALADAQAMAAQRGLNRVQPMGTSPMPQMRPDQNRTMPMQALPMQGAAPSPSFQGGGVGGMRMPVDMPTPQPQSYVSQDPRADLIRYLRSIGAM